MIVSFTGKTITFFDDPKIGDGIALDDQIYNFSRIEPYMRADGNESKLIVWISHCPECGQEFEAKTSFSNVRNFNRRCVDHRDSLKPSNDQAAKRLTKARRNFAMKRKKVS